MNSIKKVTTYSKERKATPIESVSKFDYIKCKRRLKEKIEYEYGSMSRFNKACLEFKDGKDHEPIVKKWCSTGENSKSGKMNTSFPKIDKLYELSQLLGCSIAYLAGEIDEPTPEEQIAKELTGLSSIAIKTLKDAPVYKSNRGAIKTDIRPLANTINILLSDTQYGLPILQAISDYIYSEAVYLKDKESEIHETLHLENINTKVKTPLENNDIEYMLLAKVQANLVRYKDHHKK